MFALIQSLRYLLCGMAMVTFLLQCFAIYQVYPLFICPPHYAIKGEIPFLLLWLLTLMGTIKNWRWLLWLFPVAAYQALPLQISYLYQYHHFINTSYLPNQLLALASSITLLLGILLLTIEFL